MPLDANSNLDLSGLWMLSDDSQAYNLQMTVPGDVISSLVDADLLADPYQGKNEYHSRWIAERDWTIRRQFHTVGTAFDLVLSGLDCVCTVRVNEQVVLETRNAFRTFRADISEVLIGGENVIEIQFHSNPKAALAAQNSQPYYVPYHAENSPIPHGNMLRKQQCDFGWDWNIALAPFGLYGDITLQPQLPCRIERLHIAQTHSEGHAVLDVGVFHRGGAQPYELNFAGQTITGTTDGTGHFVVQFEITDPDLWWPAGLGDQPLHPLTVNLAGQIETRSIGLRDIELVTDAQEPGAGFRIRVNGHDVFCRGANWIPADALAGRITPEKTRSLLQSAVDANMNMLRVWGGGRYEPDWFYDLCDELGLMVWQDFMFSCHLYPATDEFLDEIDQEVCENTARLHHHASITLWCGDNELIGALTWYDESRADRDRYLVAYDRLNRTVEAALKSTCPEAIWWPSSPSPGPLNFGDAWHDDSKGDMHFWSVWHEGREFAHYRDVTPRFCSEFGFQSFPSMTEINRFADVDDLNISSPVMDSHQKNNGGNARIANTMFRYFRFPTAFEDFVYLSQIQHGLALDTAVSYWRSTKPHCMGALYWQLNDTWPCASWSSLNHSGSWKLPHYMAKRFYEPVSVMVIPEGNRLVLTGVNDTLADVDLRVTVDAISTTGGRRRLGRYDTTLVLDRAKLITLLVKSDLHPNEVMWCSWQGQNTNGSTLYSPVPFKELPLLPAGVETKVERDGAGWNITVSTQVLALYVSLETETPGRFGDNALHLVPGDPKTIPFVPDTPTDTLKITIRDLYSATYRGAA